MKDCSHILSHDLQRFHDGELDARRMEELERHAATCPACQRALGDFAALGNALKAAYDEAPPAELTQRFVRRAREVREQSSRRIALGLLAAASVLFVSSVVLVVYSEAGRSPGDGILAQWEENVVWTPSPDDEFADPSAATLYAIHLQQNGASEEGNE